MNFGDFQPAEEVKRSERCEAAVAQVHRVIANLGHYSFSA